MSSEDFYPDEAEGPQALPWLMEFGEGIIHDKPPKEKCVYYHKNKTIIFPATYQYEGIPENLLLNFLGWLLLLILFAILRKRAWNYGRIALVQKTEERWTQLFYGNIDESAAGPSADAESVASVDSTLFIDKGFCSWLIAVFRIKDQNILQKCGHDAVQYLAFQRHIIFYVTIVTIISLCVVLPINFQGDLEGDERAFGHTTVSNLDPSSPYLWTHVILAVLYLPLGIIIMRRFSLSMQLEEEDPHVSRTLMITNIPRLMCDKNDLQRHFTEAYPEIEVQDIQLAYDITRVSKYDKQRERASQAKLYCENHLKKTGNRLDMRPYICGNVCCCCDVFGCATIDATEYYTEEEARLSAQVDEEKATSLQHPLGVAFVTLVSIEAAQRVHDDHAPSCKCAANPSSSSLSRQLEPHNWSVVFAPAPQDIYWENLSVSSNYWYIKAVIINLCLFVVLFFLTTPAIVVNLLDAIKFKDELQKMSPVLSQFLPTLLLWTVAALLPVLVSYSDQWLSHWTRSEQNHSVMRKTFVYLLFMVLLLPSLGLTSAQALVEWAIHQQNQTYRWECLFLPDKGALFVSYVTTSAFIGTALELIRFPELFMYAIRLCLARSTAETASVRKSILWEFPFGVQYAWMLLIFAMTIMYSLPCPLITPFGLLYMIFKHLVDRYNIYFVYSPSRINQSIHETAISCVMVGLVIPQVSFMVLSMLRRGFNNITLFSLVGFMLTMICIFAHIFLNWCKGFSPITYTRKSRRRTSESVLQPSTPARHFVPAVLQPSNSNISRSVPSYGTRTSPTFDVGSLPNSPVTPLDPHDPTFHLYQSHESRYEQIYGVDSEDIM